MKCLCCSKEIVENATQKEKEWGWHKRCVKRFFGTDILPMIELTDEALEELASNTVSQGLTVPGVQRKMSLHLSKEKEVRLTLVDYPTGYILKPQTKEYAYLPEFEQMAMTMAETLGIQTVPHALLYMNNAYAYITKRVDRKISKSTVETFAMEDFCQLSGRLTIDKYKGSYENCGRIVRRYSAYEGFDLSELFLRIVGSFVIGNSDMHLKNFSLIEVTSGDRIYKLSPAYDMLLVNIILPADKEQMALTVNGKKRNIRRKDFLEMAEKITIDRTAADRIIQKVVRSREKLLRICDDSLLPEDEKERTKLLIEERCRTLEVGKKKR